MASFVVICIDKPDSLALRLATREAHFAYARSMPAGFIRMGGPFLDEAGEMTDASADVGAQAERGEFFRIHLAFDQPTGSGQADPPESALGSVSGDYLGDVQPTQRRSRLDVRKRPVYGVVGAN